MKKIHDDSKDFKSNETHQQTMGVITRATGVLQLSAGCGAGGGGGASNENAAETVTAALSPSRPPRARACVMEGPGGCGRTTCSFCVRSSSRSSWTCQAADMCTGKSHAESTKECVNMAWPCVL